MMSAVAPIWDGNETWLVVTGVVLWGAFPIVYATLFSAFYLPLLLMLAGLILRGVAFEFRDKTRAAAVDLGRRLRRRIARRRVHAGHDRRRAGRGTADRRTAGMSAATSAGSVRSRVLCGVGLCLGYALLGACWLVRKCEGDVRDDRLSPDPLSCRSACCCSWSWSSPMRLPKTFRS